MRKSLQPFMRVAALASALAIVQAVDVAFSNAAHAGSGDHNTLQENEPDFGNLRLIPGGKRQTFGSREWYRVGVDIPAAVIDQVEQQIGKKICKYEERPGVWRTNLKICPIDHPRMFDPEYGILRAPVRTNNIFDELSVNGSYDMHPTHSDVRLARVIDEAMRAYRAAPRPQIVDGQTVERAAPRAVVRATPRERWQDLTGTVGGRQIRLKMEIR